MGGTVFSLTPNPGGQGGYTHETLVAFDSNNGARPFGGVTLASDESTLFGTTSEGGSGGGGVVFSLPVKPNAPPGNRPPSLTVVPASAAVDVGCPVTLQATATDPDGDPLTYGLVNPPAWATINPGNGEIDLDPPAGTAGSFTVTVQVSDGNGGSDQKSIAVNVCPLIIESIHATRRGRNTVIVTFNIRNTSTTTVTSVSIDSATLGGIATRTALPLIYTSIRQGGSKSANVHFTTTQNGTMTLEVNGTSSAGPVCVNQQVTAP